MTNFRGMALTLFLLLAACGQDRPSDWTEAPEVGDLATAIRIAQPAFKRARTAAEQYRLIAAQQLVSPSGVWRVTYKPESSMRPGSRVGAGGEVFVNVDLEKRTAEVGYGEWRLLVWRIARQIRIDRRVEENEVARVTLQDRDGAVLFEGEAR